MADTKLTALSEVSVPTTDDLLYWVDDPAGTPVSNKASANRVGGLLSRGVCQGRLTTESGVPVSTSDRTAQGTIYFTPYNGNLLTVYDGTRWKLYAFSELSLSLTATSGKNYDVFVYDNAGTLTLELSAAWTNDTTRADALALQDGIYVKSGATTRRWLGTIRASGSNVTADSAGGTTTQVGGQRFVWNAYNQVKRPIGVIDTTSSWTYNSATFRQANAASGNKVEVVVGAVGSLINLNMSVLRSTDTTTSGLANGYVGIGLDVTNALSAGNMGGYDHNIGQPGVVASGTNYEQYVALGYHAFNWVESASLAGGASLVTWFGNSGSIRTGLTGWSHS